MEASMNAPVTTTAHPMFLGLDDDGSRASICYHFPAWFSPREQVKEKGKVYVTPIACSCIFVAFLASV